MTKIALIEDDADMRGLLKTLLELEGFQVFAYEPEKENEVLASLQNDRPDMLLLDVHLKNANGIDLLRHIRNDGGKFRNLRVIMTSGTDIGDRCLEAGADAFLMKPYMPEELFRLIQAEP